MKRSAILLLLLFCIILIMIIAFQNLAKNKISGTAAAMQSPVTAAQVADIASIPLPAGYNRVAADSNSFAFFLRNISLRKDKRVFLFNGQLKEQQNLHYAVLDISTGNKNLQQCADAIMRLRAEYFFAKKDYNAIAFPGNKGSEYNFEIYAHGHNQCRTHDCLMKFLETVFTYCGTYTVDAMTKPITINNMQPGDVFVKAGSPGHAMIVADMAVNENTGKKIYLLAQSFMPAQDMHIVINPGSSTLSPWYELNDEQVVTPGWLFEKNQLKSF